MKTSWWLATSIAASVAACSSPSSAPAEASPSEVPVLLAASAGARLITVESALGAPWLEAQARTLAAPDATAVIGVPLPARVLRVRVRPGESVEAHAPLVDVVMPELVRAAGALAAASLRLDAHTARLQKLQPLVEQGLARAVEVAEVEAQVALIKADRESARATLRAAGVSDVEALALIHSGGALTLRAPIAGTITSVTAATGEHRDPASGPLLEITRGGAAQVEARLLTESVTGLRLQWEDHAGVVPLVLEAISPSASKPEGARLAWLHAEDTTRSLAAGLTGRVRLVPPDTWTSLPAHALGRDDQGAYVMRRDDNDLRRVNVMVELTYGDNVLVTGVNVGDRVLERITHETAREREAL